MGNCTSSIDCTAVDQPVEANPDVAGIGVRHDRVHVEKLIFRLSGSQVLVSFIATAVITFIAIVVGYLSDSLPDTSLTQFDRACIIKFSNIRWRPWIEDGPIKLLLRRSTTAAMGFLGWGSALADHDKDPEDDDSPGDVRERRSKALEKFILTLSDQQLVTGLAVLIAGYVSPCSMSFYYFNIIAALGWFSSITHLSTLAVLRVYFIEHPRLRNLRVVAMLLVLVLLAFAQVVTYTSTLDESLPLSCVFTSDSVGFVGPRDLLSIIFVIVFLGVSYSDRIVRLYSLDPEWSLQAWFLDRIMLTLKKRTRLSNLTEIAIVNSKLPQVEKDKIRRKLKERQQYIGQELVKIVIKSSNKTNAEKGALWQTMEERRRCIRYYHRSESRGSKLRRSVQLILILMEEINCSFLGDLFTLYFGVVFGITQVIVGRTDEPEAGIVGSQNVVNFGQLVPLLLMLLPLIAAGEVYFGNNNNLYAYGPILITLSLERREDTSTKPSNGKIRVPNQTHRKSFFSRKDGLADLFKVSHSTQPTSDDISLPVDVVSFLQSVGSVPRGIGGTTQIELHGLPTGRLRRPDTETGQRASLTVHSGSTRIPSRYPGPEHGIQMAETSYPEPWRVLTGLVAFNTILQTVLAIAVGVYTA